MKTSIRFLCVSDLHIRQGCPWQSTDRNEDLDFAIDYIRVLYANGSLQYDAILNSGDDLHTRAVTQEDIAYCRRWWNAINPENKPSFDINGNHDQSKEHLFSDMFGARYIHGQVLTLRDMFPHIQDFPSGSADVPFLSGHDYTSRKDLVQEFLKTSPARVLLLHQSSEPFVNFAKLVDKQLTLDDYPQGKFCICGDTHISMLYQENGKNILSPGIFYPNKDASELLSCQPQLILVEIDVATFELRFESIDIPKRPALLVSDNSTAADIFKLIQDNPLPLTPIVYIRRNMLQNINVKQFDASAVRFCILPDTASIDAPVVHPGASSCNTQSSRIVETAAGFYADDDVTKPIALNLLESMMNSEKPEDAVRQFVEEFQRE